MNYLLSEIDLEYFVGNDKKDKPAEHIQAKGFLETVLNSGVGTEIVPIHYCPRNSFNISKSNKLIVTHQN